MQKYVLDSKAFSKLQFYKFEESKIAYLKSDPLRSVFERSKLENEIFA